MQPDARVCCRTGRMGKNPGLEESMVGILVPIVLFVMLFSFLSIAVWTGSQRQEREAFYKSETLRRISEASGDGAKAAIDLMHEEERMERIRRREGLKIGGLICIGVGVGTTGLLMTLLGVHNGSPYLAGLVPGLVGVAMLLYVYKLAAPLE